MSHGEISGNTVVLATTLSIHHLVGSESEAASLSRHDMPTTRSAVATASVAAPALPRSAGSRRARSRKAPLVLSEEAEAGLLMLHVECLVEILRDLEIHELLEVAWTCKRLRQAACDESLWSYTRFSTADWGTCLQRHFMPRQQTYRDHTGLWTRCMCFLTQVGQPRRRARARFLASPLPHARTPRWEASLHAHPHLTSGQLALSRRGARLRRPRRRRVLQAAQARPTGRFEPGYAQTRQRSRQPVLSRPLVGGGRQAALAGP